MMTADRIEKCHYTLNGQFDSFQCIITILKQESGQFTIVSMARQSFFRKSFYCLVSDDGGTVRNSENTRSELRPRSGQCMRI